MEIRAVESPRRGTYPRQGSSQQLPRGNDIYATGESEPSREKGK